MVLCLCVVLFFYTVGTGHACDGVRERRRQLLDWPTARAVKARTCRTCHRLGCPHPE